MSYHVSDIVLQNGGDRNLFFCPSETSRNDDKFWRYSEAFVDPDFKSKPEPTKTAIRKTKNRVIGYYIMIDDETDRTYHPRRVQPYKDWVTSLNEKDPASADLINDVVLSNGPFRTANFHAVFGINYWTHPWRYFERSNHLKYNEPLGGNIGYVDGHAAWRDFFDMHYRYSPTHPYNDDHTRSATNYVMWW